MVIYEAWHIKSVATGHFVNSFFKLTTKKASMLCITGRLNFSHKGTVIQRHFSHKWRVKQKHFNAITSLWFVELLFLYPRIQYRNISSYVMTGVSLIHIRQLNHELGVPIVSVVVSQWQALMGTILNYDSASWWNNYVHGLGFCYDLLWLCMNWFYPYLSGLFHWHWGNHMIVWHGLIQPFLW